MICNNLHCGLVELMPCLGLLCGTMLLKSCPQVKQNGTVLGFMLTNWRQEIISKRHDYNLFCSSSLYSITEIRNITMLSKAEGRPKLNANLAVCALQLSIFLWRIMVLIVTISFLSVSFLIAEISLFFNFNSLSPVQR